MNGNIQTKAIENWSTYAQKS